MKSDHRTRLDRFGRVLVPKPLRDELGLRPGDELHVDIVDGALWIRSASLAGTFEVREDIVVYCGRRTGDLEVAVRSNRDERLESLGRDVGEKAGRR